MLRYFLLLTLLLFQYVSLPAQTTYSLVAAQEELTSGDYTHAAEILDSLEGQIIPTTNFYLALGNARLETGRTGAAILAYERGLRLTPGHSDLENNLRYAREEAGLLDSTTPDFTLLRWWRMAGAALGTTAAYAISLLLWWLSLAGALWWFLRRRRMSEKRRFALLPAATALLVLAVLFFALGYSRYEFLHRNDEAILQEAVATLRVAPTAEASAEAELRAGQKMTITDRVNRYVKVQLDDGRQGYLLLDELEII